MSFFGKRQNPLSEFSGQELEAAFKAVCDNFGEKWLSDERGTHRLQRLWSRRDALSTTELFTFGIAIKQLSLIDSKWLVQQVKLVKGKDENNQNGAIFEILAASYFCVNDQLVVPATANQKGYDIDVKLAGAIRWRISLKAYSKSIHEKLFQKKMEVVRQKVVALMGHRRLNVQVFIIASEWPTESNWQSLLASLRDFLFEYSGSPLSRTTHQGCWAVTVAPLAPAVGEQFARSHFSYTLIGIAPYHPNEQKNFLCKLESAISNLAKNCTAHDGQHAFIFLRLPPTASAGTLKGWVDEYLKMNPSCVLDGVMFLQPYTASDESGQTSHIAHYFTSALSARYAAITNPLVHLEVPVGIITLRPPLWQLQVGQEATTLEEQYIFQQGQHYTVMRPTATGQEGNIVRKAPGIHTHLVLDGRPNFPTITGRWGEEICLIGG